jgi:alkylation response protein AidB-like acyl-CoA dehydrogenase
VDLRYSDDEESFRAGLRCWLADAVPSLGAKPDANDWEARRRFDTTWQRMLFDAGYAGIDWPVEGGGRGAGPVEQLVYVEELERAHAPYVGVNFVGLLHAGPTIVVEGTSEQRARFLPPILRGDEVWCQGFSEPGAGSDLASLRTRAGRDGDEYVVTGSKVWTSHAEVADFCELLVRTGPEDSRHRGISWLILPMDAAGIEIRPLRTLAGSTEFAELFLDGVRVPVANRVGEENDGWRVTMTTLSFERGTAFVGELLQSMELLRSLRDVAACRTEPERSRLLERIGHLGAELDAQWALTRRNVSQAARTGVPGIGGSVFKLAFSELRQRLADVGMELAGRRSLVRSELPDSVGAADDGAPGNAEIVDTWLNSFSRTIAAGTSQIQRNIVAERILGLPKS